MADSLYNRFSGGTNYRDSIGDGLAIARVDKIIYGPYLEDGTTLDPDYTDITSIGAIRYTLLNSAQFYTATGAANKPAKPAFSFIHQYPVEGEFVYIIIGPSVDQNEQAGATDYYYLPPFNLWRAPNHNAFPNIAETAAYFNFKDVDYEDSFDGLVQKPNTTSPTVPLGNNFPERGFIQSVKPFVGDVIFEGRWGQSIRFGSSIQTNKGANPWSNAESDGDPIVIIRNGQGNQVTNIGYEFTVEDINVDDSSIYLTAGQSITITDLTSFPLTSWNKAVQTAESSVVIVETTLPPPANETISAQDQDNSTLS